MKSYYFTNAKNTNDFVEYAQGLGADVRGPYKHGTGYNSTYRVDIVGVGFQVEPLDNFYFVNRTR